MGLTLPAPSDHRDLLIAAGRPLPEYAWWVVTHLTSHNLPMYALMPQHLSLTFTSFRIFIRCTISISVSNKFSQVPIRGTNVFLFLQGQSVQFQCILLVHHDHMMKLTPNAWNRTLFLYVLACPCVCVPVKEDRSPIGSCSVTWSILINRISETLPGLSCTNERNLCCKVFAELFFFLENCSVSSSFFHNKQSVHSHFVFPPTVIRTREMIASRVAIILVNSAFYFATLLF